MLLTHAYALWAANVLLAVFAPAFPLSLLRHEIRTQPAQAHSLATLGVIVKNWKTEIYSLKSLWRTVRLYDMNRRVL